MSENKKFENNHSYISNVIGNISDDDKQDVIDKLSTQFDDQQYREIDTPEVELTSDQVKITEMVNDATNEFRQSLGLENFDIPTKNIHMYAESDWPYKEDGFENAVFQSILMKQPCGKLDYLHTMLHEMFHAKLYSSVQYIGETGTLNSHQSGLEVTNRAEKVYFSRLNEALMEELTIRYFNKLSVHPMFATELAETKNVLKNFKTMKSDDGKEMITKDTFYAKMARAVRPTGQIVNGQPETAIMFTGSHVINFSYPIERRTLGYLVYKIADRNPDIFKGKDDVFNSFVMAAASGRIGDISQLINKTFGPHTARQLIDLDNDVEAQLEFVRSL